MIRVKRGNVAKKHRKKILGLAKGYVGSHSRLFRIANQEVFKGLKKSYFGRKERKRWFRRLWISRINVGCRKLGLAYSRLIYQIKCQGLGLNRKMLAYLGLMDPQIWTLIGEPGEPIKEDWFEEREKRLQENRRKKEKA